MKSVYRKYLTIGIIFWAICFVVLLFSYLIVLAPQEKLRLAAERELAETSRLAESARQAAEQKNKNKLLAQFSDSERKLKEFVVDREKAENLTFDIGEISTRMLGSSSSISTAGEGTLKTDNYEYIATRQISVNFNSSFTKFAMFLNALERSRPVIFVDSFSITRSAESGSGNKVDMKLAVLVEKEAKTKGVDG
jgi:Tfp pilus assembly protein PilO